EEHGGYRREAFVGHGVSDGSCGTTRSVAGMPGKRKTPSATASSAPTICMTTNIGTLLGAMPAKVSLSMRPIVTAGLAKLVDDVNQYAATMYPATAKTAIPARPART